MWFTFSGGAGYSPKRYLKRTICSPPTRGLPPGRHLLNVGTYYRLLLLTSGDVEQNPGPKLTIQCLNIDGIRGKTAELASFLEENRIDICLLQETKLSKRIPTPLFAGYDALRCDRESEHGGGLLTLIKRGIKYFENPLPYTSLKKDSNTEIIGISLMTSYGRLEIANVYVPPPGSCKKGYRFDLSSLDKLDNLLLCGDLNAKHPAWFRYQTADARGNLLISQLQKLIILNNPKKNTRTPYNSKDTRTSPDLSICSPRLSPIIKWSVRYDLRSDHHSMIMRMNCSPHLILKPNYFYDYKNADWNAFANYVDSRLQNFHPKNFSSLDRAVESFNKTIIDARNLIIRRACIRSGSSKYDSRTKKLIRERTSLKKESIDPK
ncbi:uncharacterized protein LOC115229065 [Octopus sinensis]|uniref:Uncharacterized protein LOC115229065 n=1 Tax=Octopus sinensis TaxID=2607531 RepID=A0A6P7TZJ4_9MOLL|nr:uncharacterized protein LOC115229065 [Octopus sinensis]